MTVVSDAATFERLGLVREPETRSAGELAQEDFLNLMITQLRNQDPFKPMESGEFLGQLAQFGTVDGINELQDSFAALSSSLSSNQALQAAGLLDRTVLYAGEEGYLQNGGELSGAVELPYSASQVVVGVYGSSGQLVRRLDLGAHEGGQVAFEWDGRNESGAAVPPGRYSVRAELRNGTEVVSGQILLRGRVTNVTLGGANGPLTVGLEGLGDVDFGRVRQIG